MNPCKDTFEVHLSLSSVQIKKEMKVGRAMFGAACSGGQIFVAGGMDQNKHEIADCETYDIK
jgi:hypothetical protein